MTHEDAGQYLGKSVTLHLKNGTSISGPLASFDSNREDDVYDCLQIKFSSWYEEIGFSEIEGIEPCSSAEPKYYHPTA